MFLPVDVAVMVEMRRRAVANAAAKKFFSFSRAGVGAFSKASFGGNRSEAGRYAANVRWQGQSVDSDRSRRSDVARAKLVEAGTKLRKALSVDRGAYLARAKESLRLMGVEEEVTGEVEKFFDDVRDETLRAFVKAEISIVASLDGLDSDENSRSTRYETEIKNAQKAFVALANKFEKELRRIDPNAFVNPDNPFGVEAKRSKNFFPKRYPRSLKGSILSVFDGTVRLIATDLEQVAKDVYAVEKASFGGNRSEAGRYAANIRWQGQTVDDPSLVGYSGDVDGKQKSELHILASTTDTKLAELSLKLRRAEDSFRQSVEDINRLAGVFEETNLRQFSRQWYQFMSKQERDGFFKFKNATPEERQRLIDLAKQNAKPYDLQNLERVLENIASKEPEIARLKAEIAPLNDLFQANQWQRFFLVTNTNGHVHRSMNCSTTYETTEWRWLPHLSGLTDKEAVDDQGGILCTHCFPDAPSDYTSGESREKREAREKRAEEKKIRDAKKLAKKITADGSDVRLTATRTKTDYRTGTPYAPTTTISSITGAKEFLRDAMEFKRLPKPPFVNWSDEDWKDGMDGLHTDENVALIAGLLSEKTGDPIDKILDDAEKRARKYRGE